MVAPPLAHLPAASSRPDPLRIAALSIAIALHVAIGLALLLPVSALPPAVRETSAILVGFVSRRPPPVPPPPALAPAQRPTPAPRPEPEPAPAAAPAPEAAGAADSTADTWRFDPAAGVTLVVYGQRPDLHVGAYDTPPAELPGFREALDPSAIPGLETPGSATFDVLVGADGRPSALVILQQSCTERALEAAMAVIGQWRFAPAQAAGTPVEAWLEVSLQF